MANEYNLVEMVLNRMEGTIKGRIVTKEKNLIAYEEQMNLLFKLIRNTKGEIDCEYISDKSTGEVLRDIVDPIVETMLTTPTNIIYLMDKTNWSTKTVVEDILIDLDID